MFRFQRGPLSALRHVMYPSVSAVLRPDFSDPRWNIYQEVQIDTAGTIKRLNRFDGYTYGSPGGGQLGAVRFRLRNTLDAKLRADLRIELKRIHAELGATFLYVTHDQIEAMTMADKIVVLRDGRVEQVGRPLDLYNRPANRFVAGGARAASEDRSSTPAARAHDAASGQDL